MDDAWSTALLGWAMGAADAIAAAERDERDRPHELARPGKPVAVPGSGRVPRTYPRTGPAVRLGGSAA